MTQIDIYPAMVRAALVLRAEAPYGTENRQSAAGAKSSEKQNALG